mgnify:CR=1 FL=1
MAQIQHRARRPDTVLPAGMSERYAHVRTRTCALCEPLTIEDHVVQSMPDASPAKWHLAHTTWFFEEFVLHPFAPGYRFRDEAFRHLFNSYYNAVGPMHERPLRGLISRPTVEQIQAYRASVDDHMLAFLESASVCEEALQRVMLGLEHEQQHQELILTDIKHLFFCNPLRPAYDPRACSYALAAAAPLGYHEYAGGLVDIGHDGEGFCFDNERPRHRVHVAPFRLASRPVTNGEYLEFVRDGGYERPDHWLSDGWATVRREGWRRPMYWSEDLDSEHTLAGMRALDPHAPVCHLSYYEADAFARWANARLPTETEWEIAAADLPVEGNFVESWHLHPVPAAARTAAPEGSAPLQLFGDVWEWTSSAYAPYPGFRPLEGALGEYNGKFMVNQLVLRGGSCASPRAHLRATYRNFFPPAARWQFSGLRLAKDV